MNKKLWTGNEKMRKCETECFEVVNVVKVLFCPTVLY